MEARLSCCNKYRGLFSDDMLSMLNSSTSAFEPYAQEVTSSSGITVGQLLDAAQKLHQEHRYCVNAEEYDHRADGSVEVSVSFKGEVNVDPKDPVLLRRHQEIRGIQRRLKRKDKMSKFVEAKHKGKVSRNPVETAYANWICSI
jgi:hypothetical protein